MSDLMRMEFMTGFPLEAPSLARREEYAYRKAIHLYHSIRAIAFLHDLWARLTRKANRLLAFPELYEIINCHDLGVQAVEICRIKGTEECLNDYDDDFRPIKNHTRERWVRMAMLAWLGVGLPPVELIQVDDVYFVRDGHNRISTLRTLGCKYIDAHVVFMETSFSRKHKPQVERSPQFEYAFIIL